MVPDSKKINIDKNYLATFEELKSKIKSAQIKAHLSVNKEMLILYWQIGKVIIEKQDNEGWGTKVVDRLSNDLSKSFPNMKGFSLRNLQYMKKFAESYPNLLIIKNKPIVQAPLAQLEEEYFVQEAGNCQ